MQAPPPPAPRRPEAPVPCSTSARRRSSPLRRRANTRTGVPLRRAPLGAWRRRPGSRAGKPAAAAPGAGGPLGIVDVEVDDDLVAVARQPPPPLHVGQRRLCHVHEGVGPADGAIDGVPGPDSASREASRGFSTQRPLVGAVVTSPPPRPAGPAADLMASTTSGAHPAGHAPAPRPRPGQRRGRPCLSLVTGPSPTRSWWPGPRLILPATLLGCGEHVLAVDDRVRVLLLGEEALPPGDDGLVVGDAGHDGEEAGGGRLGSPPRRPPSPRPEAVAQPVLERRRPSSRPGRPEMTATSTRRPTTAS